MSSQWLSGRPAARQAYAARVSARRATDLSAIIQHKQHCINCCLAVARLTHASTPAKMSCADPGVLRAVAARASDTWPVTPPHNTHKTLYIPRAHLAARCPAALCRCGTCCGTGCPLLCTTMFHLHPGARSDSHPCPLGQQVASQPARCSGQWMGHCTQCCGPLGALHLPAHPLLRLRSCAQAGAGGFLYCQGLAHSSCPCTATRHSSSSCCAPGCRRHSPPCMVSTTRWACWQNSMHAMLPAEQSYHAGSCCFSTKPAVE